MKCDNCLVVEQMSKSDVPACCAWYLENVVCGDKSVDDCPEWEARHG